MTGAKSDGPTTMRPVEPGDAPLHVCLAADTTRVKQPPPVLEEYVCVTSQQEQAVSAINRDVAELVGRQKVALNDVLEENQRLQIRLNNLIGMYETWSSKVTLHAERELMEKTASVKDELSTKYDNLFQERTRRSAEELHALRLENTAHHRELVDEKERHARLILQRLEENKQVHCFMWALVIAVAITIAFMVHALIASRAQSSTLSDDYQLLQREAQVFQQQATENHLYFNGNGLKCALIKLLKPNLPHRNLLGAILT